MAHFNHRAPGAAVLVHGLQHAVANPARPVVLIAVERMVIQETEVMLGMAFAAKTQGGDGGQLLFVLDLEVAWRSMHSSTSASMPALLSAMRRSSGSAAFDVDVNSAGAGVEAVFQQLLDHRGWPLNHRRRRSGLANCSERMRIRDKGLLRGVFL